MHGVDFTINKSPTEYQGLRASPFVLSRSETGQSTKARRSIKGCEHRHLYFHSPRQVKVQKPNGVSRASAIAICTFTVRHRSKYKRPTEYQGLRASPFVLSRSKMGQSTKGQRSIKGSRNHHLYFHSPRQVKVQKRNEVSRVAGITFCTFTVRDGSKYKSETKHQGYEAATSGLGRDRRVL